MSLHAQRARQYATDATAGRTEAAIILLPIRDPDRPTIERGDRVVLGLEPRPERDQRRELEPPAYLLDECAEPGCRTLAQSKPRSDSGGRG